MGAYGAAISVKDINLGLYLGVPPTPPAPPSASMEKKSSMRELQRNVICKEDGRKEDINRRGRRLLRCRPRPSSRRLS
nr:unnamed protein product [Digitaria exilis]